MNHSRQRDVIIEYLKSTKTHPTAEEVFEAVKVQKPNISLGTVYRNLNLLADNGMILRLHMQDGIDHFDADISEHYHFYCNRCNKVYDTSVVLPDAVKNILSTKEMQENGSIDGMVIYFFGLCNKCASETGENHD